MEKPLKIAVIAGEESGDLLAADMLAALGAREQRPLELIGVGGANLQRLGLSSFFDREDIALMGVAEVLAKLPRLIGHIYRLAAYLARQKPDFLLIIDSPDFTHRVARRLRRLAPNIPIIQYVAPSVWAWRPQRAAAMRGYIDLLLVVLPFEPAVLARLNGPKSVYVGHRLLSSPNVAAAYAAQKQREAARAAAAEGQKESGAKTKQTTAAQTLLLLPGSRRSEIRRLMPVFGAAAAELARDEPHWQILLPSLPHLANELRALAAGWPIQPQLIFTEEEKWAAFAKADAALAASGTVSLELALCGVPTVLAYKTDWLVRKFILPRIKIWSAALPNIIADEPLMPEYFNEYVRPPMLARQLKRLMRPGPARQAQLQGFEKLRAIMQTPKPSAELAAEALGEAGFLAPRGKGRAAAAKPENKKTRR